VGGLSQSFIEWMLPNACFPGAHDSGEEGLLSMHVRLIKELDSSSEGNDGRNRPCSQQPNRATLHRRASRGWKWRRYWNELVSRYKEILWCIFMIIFTYDCCVLGDALWAYKQKSPTNTMYC
jgi:hypothetical protein